VRRRDFLSTVAAAAFVLPPSAAFAQQPRRIGFLRLAPSDATQLADFRAGLEETGYAEGRNLVIEYRFAEGDYTRLPDLAADLVRQNVEVIVTSGGTDAPRAAMRATSTIPIVGTSVAPVYALPLVKHFNLPEGNVTGIALSGIGGELNGKRLQILGELVPGAVIGVLVNPTQAFSDLSREAIEKAGQALQVKLVFASVSTEAGLDPAFASLAGQHVGAILPEAEPFLGNSWRRLVPLADHYRVPMMQEWREAVMAGGLLSYAPPFAWVMRQVGNYAGQILNGAKPADLPVVGPTKFELVINLKTAKTLGLAIPRSMVMLADEVIE
jgi:putative ABC transport system substrate-binding protein